MKIINEDIMNEKDYGSREEGVRHTIKKVSNVYALSTVINKSILKPNKLTIISIVGALFLFANLGYVSFEAYEII